MFNAGKNPKIKRVDLAEKLVSNLKRTLPCKLVILDGMVPASKVSYFLNASDLLIVTSDSEGSPNIIKEAAAVGLPVVTFDVGDVREILQNSDISHVVSGRNLDEMARVSLEILTNTQVQRTSYLPIQYTSENITSRIISIYEGLMTQVGRNHV